MKTNHWTKYQARPGAKPAWQVAYESGCGSLTYFHQVMRGVRNASAELARGIEVSTGGGITAQQLLQPEAWDVLWGEAKEVHQRMRKCEGAPRLAKERVNAGRAAS